MFKFKVGQLLLRKFNSEGLGIVEILQPFMLNTRITYQIAWVLPVEVNDVVNLWFETDLLDSDFITILNPND